jgi:aryl-alcohol dehydrogenase-like predicted oxidoreductase
MDKRTLGTNGPQVSAIGLGCMSMTGGYSDKPDPQEMISLIRSAASAGSTWALAARSAANAGRRPTAMSPCQC